MTAADIIAKIRSVGIDAQPDTDYYDDQIDLIPAIDKAVNSIVTTLNALKGDNKAVGEALRKLSYVYVYRTNKYSRIKIEDNILGIDAVYPLPVSDDNGTSPTATPNDFLSYKLTEKVFVKTNYSALRKTAEYTQQNRANPFSAGYDADCCDKIDGSDCNVIYAYVDAYDYNNQNSADGPFIEVIPSIPLKHCAVAYVVNHPKITATGDTILLPDSLADFLHEKALQCVSYSEGDQTTLFQVTELDIRKLTNNFK